MVGCAVRTENKMQTIDAWCAWRTLQTSPYMYAVILRINQSFLRSDWYLTLILHLRYKQYLYAETFDQ
jgi:hypothetical protein